MRGNTSIFKDRIDRESPVRVIDLEAHQPMLLARNVKLLRVLGIDVICRGSDRPYATPARLDIDPSARHAIAVTNPARLLAPALKEVSV